MFLQDERHGSAQARQVSFRFCRTDLWWIAQKTAGCDFGLYHRAESLPLTRKLSNENHILGGKRGHQHPGPASNRYRHLVQCLERTRIASIGEHEQLSKLQIAGAGAGLVVVAKGGAIGGEDFPASASTTGADGAVGI